MQLVETKKQYGPEESIYAFQDTLTPMINSIVGLATNIAASIVFSRFLGVAGVALATSLSMMIVAILSFFTLKKHLHRFQKPKYQGFLYQQKNERLICNVKLKDLHLLQPQK